MADYKELLRRAVEALPENNGAARRAVYEKARAALVGQLRAINPPLAARDITTHRLQLEDCIRQVEQEASEAVIAGMSGGHHADSALPPPVYFEVPVQNRQLPPPGPAKAQPTLVARDTPREGPRETVRDSGKTQQPGASIEDIIAAADSDARAQSEQRGRNGAARPDPKNAASKPIQLRAVPPEPAREPESHNDDREPEAEEKLPSKPAGRPGGRPLPSIVARAEAAKNRSASTAFGVPADKPYDSGRRGPTLEARPQNSGPRFEPAARGQQQAVARQQIAAPITYIDQPQIGTAMSAVREVDVEAETHPADPQGLIDRAMATLDREARGETAPHSNGADYEIEDDEDEIPAAAPAPVKAKGLVGGMFPDAPRRADGPAEKPARQPKPQREARQPARRGRESNRESAFPEAGFPRARAEDDRGGISAVTIFLIVFAVLLLGAGGAGVWAWNEGYLNLDSMLGGKPAVVADATPATTQPTMAAVAEPQSGVGNSTTTAEPMAVLPELKQDERLPTDTAAVTETPALGIAPTAEAPPAERLGTDTAAGAIGAATDTAALNPEGSQSLLLEASDDGKTGAVPFSGTVEWSKGKDETGLPTLVGKASIPARNLGVDVLIRKNVDPSLPASHLMEINFRVSDSFIGGSVAGLPGVLLKNEELVQGAPLVGASARVVGNSFLFALSASPEDTAANNQLLTSRKWIDLAIIYATGKRAIITLEKDSAAEAMFTEVFTAWGATASTAP
jgi:hypothetical protein